ncbi:Oxidoreductase FAD-binding protein [Paragonimus heterotremus]|uniref:Oxidoreductase FAD-binding protein n=1 Tax=Paragonimus heterotremus TaxID=100268 RepID=A0A8J4WY51_9TREM|nr:Oxidoreductase FAD-binding protein [Paragonimus heterotremus]
MARKPPEISVTDETANPSGETSESLPIRKRRPLGIGQWLSVMNSSEYQLINPGTSIISDKELAQHNTAENMWMALPQEGKLCVFDITKFAQYHPGGFDVLLQNSGTDASEAYRLAHSYVNVNMIGKLRKGFLRRSQFGRSALANQLLPSMTHARPQTKEGKKPNWRWTVQSEEVVELTIRFPHFQTVAHTMSWIDGLRSLAVWRAPSSTSSTLGARGLLIMRTLLEGAYHRIVFRILPSLLPLPSSLRLSTVESESTPDVAGNVEVTKHVQLSLEMAFTKQSDHNAPLPTPRNVPSIGSVLTDGIVATHCEPDPDDDESFITCRVVESSRLDKSRYRFLRLSWSSETAWMPVPLGHHVILRVRHENGHWLSRPYTPICDDPFFTNHSSHCATDLCLLVKVYPDGLLSPRIDRLQCGDLVQISLPAGQLPANFLTHMEQSPYSVIPQPFVYSAVFMLAAGSGITPMLRIIEAMLLYDILRHPLQKSQLSTVHLIWFERTEDDFVLVQELNELCARFPNRFALLRVLSEPNSESRDDMSTKGVISEAICRQGLLNLNLSDQDPSVLDTRALWLVCGPSGFHEAVVKIAQKWAVPEHCIIQFKG